MWQRCGRVAFAATALGLPARAQAHGDLGPGVLAGEMAEGAAHMAAARINRYSAMAVEDYGTPESPVPEGPAVDEDPAEEPMSPMDEAMIAGWTDRGWNSCGIDGPADTVDLSPGNLTPVQVALASRGARTVALVTLGRPAGGRRGMIFPESRIVRWEGTRTVEVSRSPGFEPDAQLALDEGEASVLSYVATEDDARAAAIALTGIALDGRVTHPTREVPDTAGMTMDSALVPWRGGVATVLARPVVDAGHLAGTSELYVLHPDGAPVIPPRELTRDARDDGTGTHRTGLATDDRGTTLTAAWAVPSGGRTGVWVRRGITVTALPPAEHLTGTAGLFGPEPSSLGVMARRRAPGADGALTELTYLPDNPRESTRHLGRWWDPLSVYTPSGPIIVGQRVVHGGAQPTAAVLLHGATELTAVPDPAHRLDSLANAVDVAVAPTPTGAVVAWISEAGADATARRLSLARVACVAEPPGAHTVRGIPPTTSPPRPTTQTRSTAPPPRQP